MGRKCSARRFRRCWPSGLACPGLVSVLMAGSSPWGDSRPGGIVGGIAGGRPYAAAMANFAVRLVHGPGGDASRPVREQDGGGEDEGEIGRRRAGHRGPGAGRVRVGSMEPWPLWLDGAAK